MEVLAKALAAILVELLRYLQGREDLKNLVRAELEAAGLKDANEALGWKAAAVASVDGGATLTVKDGAIEIKLPPPPPGGPTI